MQLFFILVLCSQQTDLTSLLPLWGHDFLFQVLYLSAEYLRVHEAGGSLWLEAQEKLHATPVKATLVSTKTNGERYLFDAQVLQDLANIHVFLG